jgi:hypothetical protein
LDEIFGLGQIGGFAVVRNAMIGECRSRRQAQESDEYRWEYEQSAGHV